MEGGSFLSLSINLIDPSLDSLPFKDKKYHDSFLLLKRKYLLFMSQIQLHLLLPLLMSTINAVVLG